MREHGYREHHEWELASVQDLRQEHYVLKLSFNYSNAYNRAAFTSYIYTGTADRVSLNHKMAQLWDRAIIPKFLTTNAARVCIHMRG